MSIDWTPFNTVTKWFFDKTMLSYEGKQVYIYEVTPDKVRLLQVLNNGSVKLPITLSIEQAAIVLQPLRAKKREG